MLLVLLLSGNVLRGCVQVKEPSLLVDLVNSAQEHFAGHDVFELLSLCRLQSLQDVVGWVTALGLGGRDATLPKIEVVVPILGFRLFDVRYVVTNGGLRTLVWRIHRVNVRLVCSGDIWWSPVMDFEPLRSLIGHRLYGLLSLHDSLLALVVEKLSQLGNDLPGSFLTLWREVLIVNERNELIEERSIVFDHLELLLELLPQIVIVHLKTIDSLASLFH